MICPKWFWRGTFYEIADADFYVGVTRWVTEPILEESARWLWLQMYLCTIPLASISKWQIKQCFENAYEIHSKISKKLYLPIEWRTENAQRHR
jgi:hypothetical protein